MASSAYKTILVEESQPKVVTIALNRPEVRNALSEEMVTELITVLDELRNDQTIRVVCLKGYGAHFCAGADLQWMQRTIEYSKSQNLAEASKIDQLMFALYALNKPTIAVVSGAAYGGGVGLTACCDIAIASEQAKFCLPEVKLGLVSAVIMPYVIAAMGQRAARRYMLTAEVMSAQMAESLGLVHQEVKADALESLVEQLVRQLLANSPNAIAADKAVLQRLNPIEITAQQREYLIEEIASIRVTDEAQEGMRAFFEKRPPRY